MSHSGTTFGLEFQNQCANLAGEEMRIGWESDGRDTEHVAGLPWL